MDQIIERLKVEIVEHLNLEDIEPNEIDSSAPLFGDQGLGLDSIDALELIVLLNEAYNLSIPNADEGTKIFYSIDSMASFIHAHD
jgi:acyl carrier protein